MQMIQEKIYIDRKKAFSTANRFILENLPDRFSAGTPRRIIFPTRSIWAVPIVLTYPNLGALDEVGMVAVDCELGCVVGSTPFEEVERAAKNLLCEIRSIPSHQEKRCKDE